MKMEQSVSTILAAFIGAFGAICGAIIQAKVPILKSLRLKWGKPQIPSILGSWESMWGESYNSLSHKEVVFVSEQLGEKIKGTISWNEKPDRKWDFVGRYDGRFVQLTYYPSSDSLNSNVIDCGCYFLERKGDGHFRGYSTGYDSGYDAESDDYISTDFHEWRKI